MLKFPSRMRTCDTRPRRNLETLKFSRATLSGTPLGPKLVAPALRAERVQVVVGGGVRLLMALLAMMMTMTYLSYYSSSAGG